MPNTKNFFVDPDIQVQLREVIKTLKQVSMDDLLTYEKANNLSQVLSIFLNNAKKIDLFCRLSISWTGPSVHSALFNFPNVIEEQIHLDNLYALIYRFVIEYDLSVKDSLTEHLKSFQRFAQEHISEFNPQAEAQIRYAMQEMPISIIKQLLNEDAFINLRDVSAYSEQIEENIVGWDKTISEQTKKAEELAESLKSYETAFNFVGLFDGFNELAISKKEEMRSSKIWMIVFGLLMVFPLLGELIYIYYNRSEVGSFHPYFLISAALASLSLTVLLIYFFRIALRSLDGYKTQLLQIELRKTLCRFIQSYSKYSKELKVNNAESLEKFENIIFSSIVSNDEKIPSTFDGLDQITNFIKYFREK